MAVILPGCAIAPRAHSVPYVPLTQLGCAKMGAWFFVLTDYDVEPCPPKSRECPPFSQAGGQNVPRFQNPGKITVQDIPD